MLAWSAPAPAVAEPRPDPHAAPDFPGAAVAARAATVPVEAADAVADEEAVSPAARQEAVTRVEALRRPGRMPRFEISDS